MEGYFLGYAYNTFKFHSFQLVKRYTTKKTSLLWRAKTAAKAQKTAAKGPFGLLRRFYLPALRCRNNSIAAVTKTAAIDLPFSGTFGLLRRAKNRRHMRLPFSQVAF